MPRIIVKQPLFQAQYQTLLEENTARLEEWMKGMEWLLPSAPLHGELIQKKAGIEVRAVKNYDRNNRRFVTFYYTFDDDCIVFLRIKIST